MELADVLLGAALRITDWLLLALAVGACYLSTIIVYRLYFHPLSKYPGPLLGRLTNLYGGYQSWKGTFHEDVSRCHTKYGPIVRYAPNRVLFNTAGGVRDIYGHRSNVIKSTIYNQMVHQAPNILTLRDKKQHAIRRRIMSQGFSENALKGFEPFIRGPIQTLCLKLNACGKETGGWSEAFDMSRMFDYLTFDIMTSVVFNRSYNVLENPEKRQVIAAIEQSNIRISVLIQADKLRFWRLDKKLFPRSIAARNIFIKFVGAILKDRMTSKEPTGRDIFSLLQNAKDDETGDTFSTKMLGAESATLIVAGSDTTSTTMAATLFYLTRNPAALAKAVSEVRSNFAGQDEVQTGTKLNSCVYLRACIDEALRMSPPAGGVLWREVQSGGAMVDEHFIPEGVDVGTGVYSLHHNPIYYPEPFKYKPERFLSKSSVDSKSYAYCPFSLGPRSCIGKSLAIMEVMLTMASILSQFDVAIASDPSNDTGNTDQFHLRDHITGAKDGPMLKFHAVSRT